MPPFSTCRIAITAVEGPWCSSRQPTSAAPDPETFHDSGRRDGRAVRSAAALVRVAGLGEVRPERLDFVREHVVRRASRRRKRVPEDEGDL